MSKLLILRPLMCKQVKAVLANPMCQKRSAISGIGLGARNDGDGQIGSEEGLWPGPRYQASVNEWGDPFAYGSDYIKLMGTQQMRRLGRFQFWGKNL